MDRKIVEFKAVPFKCNYSAESFKIYACDVEPEIAALHDLKGSKYGGKFTVLGDLHDLVIGVEYDVRAVEEVNGTYGYQYKVINIERALPTTPAESRVFLEEIISIRHAQTLLEVYPNIVQKVIDNDLDDIDLSKTKGIKEITFEMIKRKIIENFAFAKIIGAFDGLIDFTMLKKLYDAYPSIEKIKEELVKDPYHCLCSLSRVGFKTADGIIALLQKRYTKQKANGEEPFIFFDYDIITSPQRLKAALLYVLQENESEGHTNMNLKTLRDKVQILVPQATKHLINVLQDEYNDFHITKQGAISIKHTYRRSVFVTKKIFDGLESKTVHPYVDWDFKDIEKYRKTEYGELTDEQFKVFNMVQNNKVSILSGVAGSGKTTTIEQLLKALKDNRINFQIFAPTGRAAKVIAQYTGEPASTIHRGLGYHPGGGFGVNAVKPLGAHLIIVDEVSMADLWLFENLLRAIDFEHTRLLLIGDPAQLPSVGCGNVLHDLLMSPKIPRVKLTKVFRYGIGGISTVATRVRKCESYIKNDAKEVTIIGEDKGFTFIPASNDATVKVLKQLYTKFIKSGISPEDIMVITSYNKGDIGTVKINKILQRIANPNVDEQDFKKIFKVGETTFFENDLVIQNKNNYSAHRYLDRSRGRTLENFDKFDDKNYEKGNVFIANGEIGVVELIEKDHIIIRFDTETIIYNKAQALNLKLAYSISTHKSQGGQCKYVIFLTPSAHTYMLNSNLIYVGVTRTQERCYQIGQPVTANKAVKKKANLQRNTNLPRLLNDDLLVVKEYEKYCRWYEELLVELETGETGKPEEYEDEETKKNPQVNDWYEELPF